MSASYKLGRVSLVASSCKGSLGVWASWVSGLGQVGLGLGLGASVRHGGGGALGVGRNEVLIMASA